MVSKPVHEFSESIGRMLECAIEAKARHEERCRKHGFPNPMGRWPNIPFISRVYAGPVEDDEGRIVRDLEQYLQVYYSYSCNVRFYREGWIVFSDGVRIEVTTLGQLLKRDDGRPTINWVRMPHETNPIHIKIGTRLIYWEYGPAWAEPDINPYSDHLGEGQWIEEGGYAKGGYAIRLV